ncbi:MAG: hypothetical protein ACLQVK_11975 [Acidimicrobiales bacterium]|jgi:hypothetical protein
MNYHWEFSDSGDNPGWLLEEGETVGPTMPEPKASIARHSSGTQETFVASGPLLPEAKEFDTFQEAMDWAEGAVRGAGNTIDGR